MTPGLLGMLQCLPGALGTSGGWRGGEGGGSGPPARELGHSDLDTEARMQMEEEWTPPFVKYHRER